MISVSNLCKTFRFYASPADRIKEVLLRRCLHREFQALRDVSFRVEAGETLGIIGENGAGKSTLLKILLGVLMADSGRVDVDGRVTGLLELGTGFNPEFTGIENVYLNATLLGMDRADIGGRLDEIVEFTELGQFVAKPLKTYSSGMIMRLAFSIAIHAAPQAFVVDEALAVGDAYFQQKCMTRIRQFREQGGSIIFVSHDMNAVKVLCDKALLLEHGRVIEAGEPEAVIDAYNYLMARKVQGESLPSRDAGQGEYGNGRARIGRVELLDGTGQEAAVLVSGRPVSFRVEVQAEEDLEDATLGILIRDRFGQEIYGTNTFHMNRSLCLRRARRVVISYAFDELNIGPGRYTLTVALHSRDTHVQDCYHWIDAAKSFEIVRGEEFFLGLARLTPRLCVEEG